MYQQLFVITKKENEGEKPVTVFLSTNIENALVYFEGYTYLQEEKHNLYKIGEISNKNSIITYKTKVYIKSYYGKETEEKEKKERRKQEFLRYIDDCKKRQKLYENVQNDNQYQLTMKVFGELNEN